MINFISFHFKHKPSRPQDDIPNQTRPHLTKQTHNTNLSQNSISDQTTLNKAKQEQKATQIQTTKTFSTKLQKITQNWAKQYHSINPKPNHSKQYHIYPQESKLINTKGANETNQTKQMTSQLIKPNHTTWNRTKATLTTIEQESQPIHIIRISLISHTTSHIHRTNANHASRNPNKTNAKLYHRTKSNQTIPPQTRPKQPPTHTIPYEVKHILIKPKKPTWHIIRFWTI